MKTVGWACFNQTREESGVAENSMKKPASVHKAHKGWSWKETVLSKNYQFLDQRARERRVQQRGGEMKNKPGARRTQKSNGTPFTTPASRGQARPAWHVKWSLLWQKPAEVKLGGWGWGQDANRAVVAAGAKGNADGWAEVWTNVTEIAHLINWLILPIFAGIIFCFW